MRLPSVRGAAAWGPFGAPALALSLALSAPLCAQTLPSPLAPRAAADALDGATGLPVLDPDAGLIAELSGLEQVTLLDVVTADGAVDVQLERVDLERLELGFFVDGRAADGLLDGLALSVWTGTVVDARASDVVLGFSHRGVSGWIEAAGTRTHLLPRAGAGGWAASEVLIADEEQLAARGLTLPADYCDLDELAARGGAHTSPVPSAQGPAEDDGACTGWVCPIAIETDYQMFQVFGDLAAETAYVTTLLAAVSDRYVEQVDTTLTFPYVQFYTTPADPWSTPESGGSSIDMLDEFVAAWSGAVPADAVVGHYVSGADLGGGVAYLGVLCDTAQQFSFAVSGNLSGDTPFPIQVGPLNWDFIVIAHETGHNFNSPHTHDYVPQIDNCAGGDCITDGTVMSYCHLCPGGMSNMTTYFYEPTVVDVMMAHADACLESVEPLVADAAAQPTLVEPDVPTPLSVTLLGDPVGTVDLNYRLDGGAFSAIAMTDQGGGVFTADLPATGCGSTPEWFFSVVDETCGAFSTETFAAEVGTATTLLSLDFETAAGWTAGAPGDDATTGIWERDDPIGTAAQPEDDVTASGTDCWFTGQGSPGGSLGENDVDGGKTTLTSAPIDLSSGDARVAFRLWYSNDTGNSPGADVLEVDVSNDGSTWVNAITDGPSGASGGWEVHEFVVSDFVAPSAGVQVRFVAADEGDGSIVEAAVDEFSVFRVECGVTCQTDLGFGGPGTGTLSVCGGDLSSGTSATLEIAGATPLETAFLAVGVTNAPTPFKGGTIVPFPWTVLVPLPLDGTGATTATVPGGGGPLAVYVQAIYVDDAQAQGYGLTNAVQVDLLP